MWASTVSDARRACVGSVPSIIVLANAYLGPALFSRNTLSHAWRSGQVGVFHAIDAGFGTLGVRCTSESGPPAV
ncbi:hypothetical protein HYPSUDRAFT_206176 [Hypholoma sublateritium FD-334 SS-4]|uniref:Uncharacterized protein n=1 Tax=Hypholoma sublateritium (strain FD-334 SS-4) TaxID=945553 RepID=A0A0D2NLD6_HYPSF|nr:hypothetical protein HYPSUDRAFT_206176 [Hypholoma sublateritium FD-334 SS-4]